MESQVAEIMGLIEASADDPRLRWSPDRTTVTVVFSRLILDGGPMLAPQGRRARFGDAWRAAMAEHGWVSTGQSGMFTRPRRPGELARHYQTHDSLHSEARASFHPRTCQSLTTSADL
jgi:hypothetical protein